MSDRFSKGDRVRVSGAVGDARWGRIDGPRLGDSWPVAYADRLDGWVLDTDLAPDVTPNPIDLVCPKCGAKADWNCNPHRDKATGKPIYREPHRRRVEAMSAQLPGGDT